MTTGPSEPPVRDPLAAVPVVPDGVRATKIGDGLLLERRLTPSGPVRTFVERTFGLRRERRFELDHVGTDFYAAIDGTRTLADIETELRARHALSAEDGRKAVTAFTKALLERELVLLRLDG